MSLVKLLCPAMLLTGLLAAQPIPSYSSNEDYCYHNPNAPTCHDGKPIVIDPSLMKEQALKLSQPAASRTTASTSQTAAPVPRAMPATAPLRMPQQARPRRGAPADIRLGELDWRLLEPHADLYIGLNMSGLLEAELSRTLIGEWAGKLGATEEEKGRLIAALGDVSQAVISVHSNGILAVLVGRLESFPEIASVGGLQMRRLSADTILLGTDWTLRFALHRLNFALEDTPFLNEARRLSQTYHFWACGKPAGFSAFGQRVPANSPVSKIDFGVSFRDGLRMDMDLQTSDAATANRILQASSKGTPRGMDVRAEGGAIHYAMALDRDTALARFRGFITDSMGKQFVPLLAAAREIAAREPAAPRRAPGKIVIDGLDDGPREVPVGQKQ